MEERALGHFIIVYQKFAATENKSNRTIETVTAAVRDFNRFLGVAVNPRDVKPEDLRNYIENLQDRPKWSGHPHIKTRGEKLSPHSVASYARSIRSFWAWLKREGFIEHNPFKRVKVPKAPRKIVNTFSVEQVNSLLKVIPVKHHSGYRDYAIVITLYGTGLRSSELTGLKLEDVDLGSGQIRVMGKGGKQRSVYMSATVFKVLFKYRHNWRPKVKSEYLFIHENGQPINRYYLAHRLHAYGKKAKIKGIRCSPHTFRHSFAVGYLRSGGDVFTLQRILGHSTLEMTRHYAEIADSDVEERQKAYSPAEKLQTKP
ncbi:tyrosine-type recombinase/integrase [Chloroflexota bacterium]